MARETVVPVFLLFNIYNLHSFFCALRVGFLTENKGFDNNYYVNGFPSFLPAAGETFYVFFAR